MAIDKAGRMGWNDSWRDWSSNLDIMHHNSPNQLGKGGKKFRNSIHSSGSRLWVESMSVKLKINSLSLLKMLLQAEKAKALVAKWSTPTPNDES